MRVISFLLVIVAGLQVHSSEPMTIPPFENFKMITERNIFDGDRRKNTHKPDHEALQPVPEPVKQAPPPTVLSLTGVLLVDGAGEAFVAGSRPDLSGVFTVGDLVCGLTVREVTTDGIEVEKENGNRLSWLVGSSIQKENDNWGKTGNSAHPVPGIAVNAGKSAAHTEAADAPAANDILKLLQERRRKELSK